MLPNLLSCVLGGDLSCSKTWTWQVCIKVQAETLIDGFSMALGAAVTPGVRTPGLLAPAAVHGEGGGCPAAPRAPTSTGALPWELRSSPRISLHFTRAVPGQGLHWRHQVEEVSF